MTLGILSELAMTSIDDIYFKFITESIDLARKAQEADSADLAADLWKLSGQAAAWAAKAADQCQ